MKYILLLVFLCSNIGYTQTLIPKQALYDSLTKKNSDLRNMFNFLTYSRVIALTALSPDPDTASIRHVTAFYILLKDSRTNFPYDYYLQFDLPSENAKFSMDRMVTRIGFIWKIDHEAIWVVEIDPHKNGIDENRGVQVGKYPKYKFYHMLKHSYYYDKERKSIERK